ncbi:MAG: glucose-6-phosphate dehydrogenase [Erysipelotrichaceae bacterium]
MKNKLVFTIFGSTGDLTYRKLIPALYNLLAGSHLDQELEIRCIGRKALKTEDYLQLNKPWIESGSRFPFKESIFLELSKQIRYIQMDMTKLEDYHSLKPLSLDTINIYYLAVAPEFFESIADNLKQSNCLNKELDYVILEKPFGLNSKHAKLVHQKLSLSFKEAHILHIDHYIGKEMIQNILAIRFANRLFETIWNNNTIEQIQITAAETIGIENRGAYYEQAGALQDMVQNHLLQLVSYVVMDQPEVMDHHHIQAKQINAIQSLMIDDCVFGQYSSQNELKGYREEEHIAPDSQTETYIALQMHVKAGALKGVPIFVRSGKRLNQRATYISVHFKKADNHLYSKSNLIDELLLIKIQPDEGIYFRFNAKKPGTTQDITPIMMNFCQNCIYENRINTPEAYERLLDGAFHLDLSLFTPFEMVELSWAFGSKIAMLKGKQNLEFYSSQSEGPLGANTLLRHHGYEWTSADISDEAYQ